MRIDEVEERLDEEEGPNLSKRIRQFLGIKTKKKRMAWSHRQKKNIGQSFSRRTTEDRLKALNIPRRPSTRLNIDTKLDGGIRDEGPSVFLQELCHLMSLLSAVAMSTLRQDRPDLGQSPLVQYEPGDPMPPEDPDDLPDEIREEYNEGNLLHTYFMYVMGETRTTRHQTLYNAVRPFGVLGGVSDAEVEMLKSAHTSQAKVALCSLWVYEYIIRESMHGSLGKVPPPIISRLNQFISDGMMGYNEARKIATIPFPFPHAQICVIFTALLAVLFPTLYLSYSEYLWFGGMLNFFTMLCFTGLHEVARELENPFQNTPNDLPLPTFQAQFNDMLVTMYSGFHPDSYWTISKNDNDSNRGLLNFSESNSSKDGTAPSIDLLSSSTTGYGSVDVVTHS